MCRRRGAGPFCLPWFTMGLPQSQDSADVPSGEFPVPVAQPVPGPGPQVGGWEVFLTTPHPSTPHLSPASLCEEGSLYFSIPSAQNSSLLLHPGYAPVSRGWEAGGGLSPQGGKAEAAVPLCFCGSEGRGGGWGAPVAWIRLCSFPTVFGDLLCISSL